MRAKCLICWYFAICLDFVLVFYMFRLACWAWYFVCGDTLLRFGVCCGLVVCGLIAGLLGAGTWIRLLLGGLFVCWIWRFVIYAAGFALWLWLWWVLRPVGGWRSGGFGFVDGVVSCGFRCLLLSICPIWWRRFVLGCI